MAINLQRALFTIARHEGGWAVEHEGEFFDPSSEREEVVAAACRRARASNEGGAPARVCVQGDSFAFRNW